MPELPEVEIMGQNLRRWLTGSTITRLEVLRDRSVLSPGAPAAALALVNQRVRVHRRGKVLMLHAPDQPVGVFVRFGMTGKVIHEADPPSRSGARLRLHLTHVDGSAAGCITYLDARNLGSWAPARVSGDPLDALAALVPGHDAWLDPPAAEAFMGFAEGSRRPIKAFLMEQQPVAGIGNILATELLFESHIHPQTAAGALDLASWQRICSALPQVIDKVLQQEASDEIHLVQEAGSVNPFRVYGRAGAPCPRCATPLGRVVIAGRGSIFCQRCQPGLPASAGAVVPRPG